MEGKLMFTETLAKSLFEFAKNPGLKTILCLVALTALILALSKLLESLDQLVKTFKK